MNAFLSLFCGFIFAVGLGLSGMTDPNKVIGFLTLNKDWDPSLAFVMAGAIAIHGTTYFLFRKQKKPFFAPSFSKPATSNIDSKLIIGALMFGLGWGLGGFCPGPAIVSTVSLHPKVGVFVVSMLSGFFLVNVITYMLSFRKDSIQ
ncbi:MAG: hypothetical protein CL916_13500 [Deltaproteobacteria bacterium]|nr:hypothetical protein [Deltaproteobacteria bacterium]